MQHSYSIQNQAGAAFRADLNDALTAIVSNNSGPEEPNPSYAFQWWADTTSGILKQRNAANNDWVNILSLSTGAPSGISSYAQLSGATFTGPISVPSLNGGQLAGMRNKIINGAFQVNQRVYVSGATTAAGQYTLDRWKVTSTAGVSFSTTANKTTVSIPAGQTLKQVIEGLNLQTGTYVLSWEGTAQGRIGAGQYGVSGAVTAAIVGGENTTIEFSAGTVARAQLEVGEVATPFEHRPYGLELSLCQRYYEVGKIGSTGSVTLGHALGALYPFAVRKRATPTMAYTNVLVANASTTATDWNTSESSVGVWHPATTNGNVSWVDTFTASAEL